MNIKFVGPYASKVADGLTTPLYIFEPGAIRKDVGEVVVTVDGGMSFEVKLNEEHQDVTQAVFEVPMRYSALMGVSDIEWAYNCLTAGIHHGRPEKFWHMPLLYAVQLYSKEQLQTIVVARIYHDAMQYVEHGDVEHGDLSFTQTWAEQIKQYAEDWFPTRLQVTVGEIARYYKSAERQRDIEQIVELVDENRLNPGYEPLHIHDSINLLCRMLGVKCSLEASKDQNE